MQERETQFEEAYELHVDALFTYCSFKVNDRETAKDLVQETFTKTWIFIAGGGTVDAMKPFLFRTLRNLIIDYYRKKKPVSLDSMTEDGFDPGADETEELFEKIDGARAVALLRELPADYGDILYMRYVEGLSLEEIAPVLGVTKNTATVRAHRGLKMLKKLFEHE